MTVNDIVAARVREVRKRRGWSPADLAARCAALGAGDLTENVIENIESRSRRGGTKHPRPVTVDELLALALALNVAPVHLIVPPGDEGEPCQVGPVTSAPCRAVRRWIRGFGLLADLPDVGAQREYMTEVPDSEFDVVHNGMPQRLLDGRLRAYERVMFAKMSEDEDIRAAAGGFFRPRETGDG
jgi:transcriptional regulator with XRE-family HTH domain